MNILTRLLESEGYLLLDGAMGTMLMAAGLESGAAPEAWNVSHPDRIRQVHRAYIEAGSNVILTNSFGGSSFRLKLHGLDDRVFELNKAAAENARAEADAAARPIVVAGSIGPSGELLEPMGAMTYEEAVDAFAKQARGLAAGGADVLWVETMSDLDEARAAVEGSRRETELPICATLSFDTNRHTMMGVSPAEAAATMGEWGLAAVGANCGDGIDSIEYIVSSMRDANPDLILIAKANAGIPHWHGEELAYDGTPEIMAGYARRVRDLGATLIGACCGSSPAHIEAMAGALRDYTPQASPLPMVESPPRSERRRRRSSRRVRRR